MRILPSDTAHSILAHGVSMLGQSAVLVLIVALVDTAFRHRLRPALRHALWLLVLVELLLPPALTLPTGLAYWIPASAPARPVAPEVRDPGNVAVGQSQVGVNPSAAALAAPANSRPPMLSATMDWSQVAIGVWAAGSLGIALLIGLRKRTIARLVTCSIHAGPELNAILEQAAMCVGVRRVPALRLTQCCHSPAVHGCFRSIILIPAAMANALDPQALRGVFLHELTHVRRRDLWVQLLQLFVQVIWWWNPAVWIASARLRVLRELAVDEEVQRLHGPEQAQSYPAALVEVARFVTQGHRFDVGLVGIVESARTLRHRVTRLLENPSPTKTRLGPMGWGGIVAVGLLLLPMGFRPKVIAENPSLRGRAVRPAHGTEDFEQKTFGSTPLDDAERLSRVLQRKVDFASRSDVSAAMREYLVSSGLAIFRDRVAGSASTPTIGPRMARIEPSGDIVARLPESEMERLEQALVDLRGVPGEVFTVCQVFELNTASIDLSGLTAGLETHALTTRSNVAVAATLPRSVSVTLRDRIVDERLGKRVARCSFTAVDPQANITQAPTPRLWARAVLDAAHANMPRRVRDALGLDSAELPKAFDAGSEVPAGHLLVVLGRSRTRPDGTVRQWLYLVDPRR